jgi:GNAT superfamily N-acetyltransferase
MVEAAALGLEIIPDPVPEIALAEIGERFYAGPRLAEWYERRLAWLGRVKAGRPAPGLTCARMWRVTDASGQPLAGMLVTLYPYSDIRPQRNFSLRGDELTVERFGELVNRLLGAERHRWAVELSYFYVDEIVRGRGLGRTLFQIFMDYAMQFQGSAMAFTVARGAFSDTELGVRLMRLFLWHPDAPVMVQRQALYGVLPETAFGVHKEASATAHLARSFGFLHAGYNKNLGELWLSPI